MRSFNRIRLAQDKDVFPSFDDLDNEHLGMQ